jgi:branched-chain amino acid transport system substrate-binding protein
MSKRFQVGGRIAPHLLRVTGAAVVAIALVSLSTGAGLASSSAPGPIVVGNITSISGFSGTFATFHSGAQAYFNYVNAHGGVNGRKIKFITKDDAGNPAKAAAAAKQLLQAGAVATVADANVGTEAAAAPILASKSVPAIGGWGNGSEWYGANTNLFVIMGSPGDASECEPWLADGVAGAGAKDVAVFEYNQPASEYDAKCLEQRFAQNGVKEVTSTFLTDPNLADYRSLVQQAMNAGAKDIVANYAVGSMVLLIQAGEALGFKGRYFGGGGVQTSMLQAIGSLAPKMAGRLFGISFAQLPSSTSNPAVKLAEANLPASVRSDVFTLVGWAAAVTFVDAVKKVGPSSSALLKYMQGLNGYTAHGLVGPMTYKRGFGPAACVIRTVVNATGNGFVRASSTPPNAFSCSKLLTLH